MSDDHGGFVKATPTQVMAMTQMNTAVLDHCVTIDLKGWDVERCQQKAATKIYSFFMIWTKITVKLVCMSAIRSYISLTYSDVHSHFKVLNINIYVAEFYFKVCGSKQRIYWFGLVL